LLRKCDVLCTSLTIIGKGIQEFFDGNTRLIFVGVNPFVIYVATRDIGIKDNLQSPHSMFRLFCIGT